MINIYRYGGHKNLHEDCEIQELEARANEILVINGPFLQVIPEEGTDTNTAKNCGKQDISGFLSAS